MKIWHGDNPLNFHIEVWILTMLRTHSAKMYGWYIEDKNHLLHPTVTVCSKVAYSAQHVSILNLSSLVLTFCLSFHLNRNISFHIPKQSLFKENNWLTEIILTFLFMHEKVSSVVLKVKKGVFCVFFCRGLTEIQWRALANVLFIYLMLMDKINGTEFSAL